MNLEKKPTVEPRNPFHLGGVQVSGHNGGRISIHSIRVLKHFNGHRLAFPKQGKWPFFLEIHVKHGMTGKKLSIILIRGRWLNIKKIARNCVALCLQITAKSWLQSISLKKPLESDLKKERQRSKNSEHHFLVPPREIGQ